MTSRWFALSLALLLAITLLISGALAIGTLTPLKPVLTAFEPCADTICWLNINIQQDSPDEVRNVLRARGFVTLGNDTAYYAPDDSHLCDMVFGGAFLLPEGTSSIQLLNCDDLQLGDVRDILGEPQLIAIDCFDTWVMWYDNIAVLTYGDLTPRSSVFQIIFFHPAAFDRPSQGVQWHGFTSLWRYQQLEPDIRDC